MTEGKVDLDTLLAGLIALAPEAKAKAFDIVAKAPLPVWVPNPGPQTEAYFCEADELFYGGQAGGGKTALIIGLSLTAHRNSLLLRRIGKDAAKLADHIEQVVGHRRGYNGTSHTWKLPDRKVDLGSCEMEQDKHRHKGEPHDLIGFDEGSDFLYSQYRFITTWLRSEDPGQRCRIVVASNPPLTAQGLWVIKHWAAWLDPQHPNPAQPAELRWYLTIGDDDVEVDGPGPHEVPGRTVPVRARSRTYLPARMEDNPDYARGGYASVLENLPEELRRAYREGDFGVGQRDDDFQVIPTAWIEAAMARWSPAPPAGMGMTAMGVDVAQGGSDKTVLAYRYAGWFGPLVREKGENTQDGNAVAAMVVRHRRDKCPVVVDVGGGWGGDALARIRDNGIPVLAHNGVGPSMAISQNGALKFLNKRAEAWWRLREALDPDQECGSVVALPRDAQLKADLCAPRWKRSRVMDGKPVIQIEDKLEIRKRLGRSPDDGDAVAMAVSEGERAVEREARRGQRGKLPQVNLGYSHLKRPR